ncbi:glycosyltransferase [Candidatus Woesearchaeota archaeon]|jgi:teichuronic acid biosynthesis glycosyltransferase TuaC|nr:glycosyltransferase [Candidatus Woesearchaeota archaeon]MBT4368016.1 glycosyltransferase [Candidatus Woesearchaeota archaeon]MBT4712504.1 glycosyltransferase [Candidatus Woesearchaeota archaeon]MBT6639417.1 glycosyltransferase [Candidatus Woesearchaeota archaeon]MBT7133589.1 glycosyltransferase [Candidatus Woesearchaeota archaeon]
MKVLYVLSGNVNTEDFDLRRDRPFIFEQVEELKSLGVETTLFLIKGKKFRGYLKNLSRLRKTIKNNDFDLVHAHHGTTGWLTVLQRICPVVVTFHGSDVNFFKLNLFSSFAGLFSKYGIFVTKKLHKKILLKPRRSSIIPCGVDIKTFFPINQEDARQQMGLDLKKKYVLFSSSFSRPVKNYPLAKEVMDKFEDVELLELKGYSREQVNLLMNASDLLLMTSFREGSPLAIKEALACNLPIVSTDIGDVKELFGNNENCHLTSFDAKEIEEKVKLALTIGKNHNERESILHLSNENIAKRIFQVYTDVLNEK